MIKRNTVKTLEENKIKNERVSIFVKMITSNILIGVIPMLVVSLIILMVATKAILMEVKEANISLTEEISHNMDMTLTSLVDSSNLMITNTEMVNVVAKNVEDYDSLYSFDLERSNVIESSLISLSVANSYVDNMVFVKKSEVIELSLNEYYESEEFRTLLFESENYLSLDKSRKNLIWYYDEYDTKIYFC